MQAKRGEGGKGEGSGREEVRTWKRWEETRGLFGLELGVKKGFMT